MTYRFSMLWNAMFLFMGPLWFLLCWMIWESEQLQSVEDKLIYLVIVIPGFFAVYLSGFFIERWHKKKQRKA